ncbi:tripartite tricarboxylate transporter permease [Marimonas lutisalis]|uniref:tripartite tricarboxylate transporter permease n=1 Tax=Marimonas lutisalis TaxID=2545756 RepID=UPI0010F9374D|nr:tripartite tricarboxylate transporter permease [Marimonas lutisalis]
MPEIEIILAGLGDAFQPVTLLFVLAGVALGQFVGAVPGIGPVMAMAIAIPFTFGMDPLAGIGFLVGVNKGGLVGGAIPAVLMNTPGTPDAAATAFDGYPLAKQGKPLKATKMALYSSVTGDTFSDIVLITVSAPLAILALKMGPVEVLGVMLLAFAVIAGLMGASLIKGAIAIALGLLAAMVGTDPEHATPRFIFGNFELYDGLPLASVAIGMLAISELLRRLSETSGRPRPAIALPRHQPRADRSVSWAEYWGCRFTIARGAVIGTILGALPGIGSTAAAFMSYASAKAASKQPASFGKGNLHGIAATEAANSSVMGANMIPLLTLGIPGSVSAALIISAFMIHGVQPGPFLFEQQGRLIYGLFGAMIIANMLNLLVGQLGLRFWARVITAPEPFIFASALLMCFVGVSLASGGLFGVGVMLVFALLAFVMSALGLSVVVFIIAFFLGPRLEISLSQTLALLNGDPLKLLNYPVALVLMALAAVTAVMLARRRDRGHDADENSPSKPDA